MESGSPVTVCLIEKGPAVGAHILSGMLMNPLAFDELFPDLPEVLPPSQDFTST